MQKNKKIWADFVSEQNNATIETLFVNNDIDLKNLKENKTLIAYDFYQKVLNS